MPRFPHSLITSSVLRIPPFFPILIEAASKFICLASWIETSDSSAISPIPYICRFVPVANGCSTYKIGTLVSLKSFISCFSLSEQFPSSLSVFGLKNPEPILLILSGDVSGFIFSLMLFIPARQYNSFFHAGVESPSGPDVTLGFAVC